VGEVALSRKEDQSSPLQLDMFQIFDIFLPFKTRARQMRLMWKIEAKYRTF